jgi:hypothetical protein
LKISFLSSSTIKSPNRIFIVAEENDRKAALILHKNCFIESLSLSSLGACAFKTMILHHRPLRTIYDILSLTNSILLTTNTILWCTKNPVPNQQF